MEAYSVFIYAQNDKIALVASYLFSYGQYSNAYKGKSVVVCSEDAFIIFIFDTLIYCSIYLKPKMLYCFIAPTT